MPLPVDMDKWDICMGEQHKKTPGRKKKKSENYEPQKKRKVSMPTGLNAELHGALRVKQGKR